MFGFKSGDESWEILENGNALVSFKSDDFTNWKTSFEARYPEDNTNITRLQQFVAWVASTNTEGQSETEKAARLAKFKNELADWADVEDAIFYYLFTLVFLCIDQREKNAFPTYNAEMAKWLWLFYDADSSIGTDNKGNLTFEYWMEDIDFTEAGDPVFNGQNNVFWSNLRQCFPDEIRDEYRRLRTEIGADGKPLLSYDKVNELFEAHQSQWSEAIYNEDAWRKAVEPLEKSGDAQYLSMQQGKKEQHFKHWMYNRFRYLDSKFETGAALDETNRIMMRAHAQGNIFLTSYINMYGQVYFNAARAEHRMVRDQEYEFEWNAVGAEDAVIGVNSAPMITSLGDLSPLKLEYAHIQYATHLTELKVGDASSGYVNDNFVELTLGNNTLLRKLDVRNCTSLTQSVDASGCTNIEEVYFDNTAITGVTLPNGGILKKLHLPGTMTNLTLRNQTALTEFVMPSFANVTTLRLENVPSIVDGWTILHQIPANSRVRMIGFDWTQDSPEAVLELYDYLDTMRGLDENGNNVDKPQMQGTIRIDSLTGAQLTEMQSRYPSIKVEYQHITSNLFFYDDTGATLLYTASCTDGADGVYGGSTPTKTATAQYTYTFANSWSLTPGGTASANALKNVTADRSVYAVFNATVRTYTVYWKNGSTTLETDSNVPYGTTPTYNGSNPTHSDPDYKWNGWSPAVGPITGDTTYTAKFKYSGYVYPTLIDGSISGDYVNDTVTSVGDDAFGGCTDLTSVSMAKAASIGVEAFSGCSGLVSAKFPAATSMGADAFRSCPNLQEVDVSKVTAIPFGAFYGCAKLTTVRLNATAIGSTAFQMCEDLTALVLYSETMATLEAANALIGTPIANGTGYIYVPAALIATYQANSKWSSRAAQFRALEDHPEVWDPYRWESVNYHIEQGDYATFYQIGDEVPLNLGTEGEINMQVAAFDTDDLADGSGKAPITFIAKELLKTKKSMNASVTSVYDYPEQPSWTASGNTWTSQNRYVVSTAEATWTITAVTDGTLTISYKVSNGFASRNAIDLTVNGEAVATNYASTTAKNHTVNVVAGDVVTVTAVYDLLSASYSYYGTVAFSSTGEFSVSADVKDAPTRGDLIGYAEGTGAIGGWEKCELRTYLKNTIKPLIPESVVSMIQSVTKTQRAYNTDGVNYFTQTTQEDVWLPIIGETTALCPTKTDRIKCLVDTTTALLWWTRQAAAKDHFTAVNTSGGDTSTSVNGLYGVCLGFCVGSKKEE